MKTMAYVRGIIGACCFVALGGTSTNVWAEIAVKVAAVAILALIVAGCRKTGDEESA